MHKLPSKTFTRLTIAIAATVAGGCSSVDSKPSDLFVAKATLHNPFETQQQDAPWYTSYYDLGLPGEPEARPLVMVANGKVVPSQPVDENGDGKHDGLFTVLDFKAGETHDIIIRDSSDKWKPVSTEKRTQAEISIKDGGEWVPREGSDDIKNYQGGRFKNVDTVTPPAHYTDHSFWIRYEGPGIESDKVGYRVYLDWRNGFDIFGKNLPEPVLQHIGQDGYDSYHEMSPWGQDILKVGDTLGAGGFGYWDGSKVQGVAKVDSRTATVVDDGSLRSSVRIDYMGWRVADLTVDLNAYLTMNAGSRLVHNQISISDALPNIAAGIVNHPNTTYLQGELNIPADSYSYLATWGQQSLAGDDLGLAIFFKKRDLISVEFDGKSRIAVLEPARGKVDYYFAAVWAGEHKGQGVKSLTEFKQYLEQAAQRLTRPLRVDLDTRISNQKTDKPLTAEQVLYWGEALADSELARKALDYRLGGWDAHRKRSPKFEYDIVGLLPLAFEELAQYSGEKRFHQVAREVTASFVGDDGSIATYKQSDFNIDSIAPGRVLLDLYQDTGEEKFRKAAATLREQLRKQPRTSNGAFWHKQRYPGQLWLDGVYMGMPFLARYTTLFERGEALDEVVNEFRVTRSVLRDPKTGLYYHAWDEQKEQEWADANTGLSANFWARGMGWMAMALVDVLDDIPSENREQREFLLAMILDFAKTLARYQHESGTWWQVVDKPDVTGNYLESTGSAMFTYFLAKAVNKGYITNENFGDDVSVLVRKSFQGLLEQFMLVHADGKVSMTNQCHVAGLGFGRDGSYDYYMDETVVENDPKGTGPFILAAIQVSQMLNQTAK